MASSVPRGERTTPPGSPGPPRSNKWTVGHKRFTMDVLPSTPGGTSPMRVLLVHPSPLLYAELYLRLEPLGLERVAAAVRAAGHDVRLMDLQVFTQAEYL